MTEFADGKIINKRVRTAIYLHCIFRFSPAFCYTIYSVLIAFLIINTGKYANTLTNLGNVIIMQE